MKVSKILSLVLAATFACTAFASCTAIENAPAQNGAAANTVAPGALTYIGLRINPEIEMVADENGVIVSANAVNEDGEVVLSEVELEGKTAEEATEAFTDTALELGYLDPAKEKDTVYVDVNGENAEAVAKVEKSLSDKVMKFFEKKGIAGKVSKEVLDTYLATAEEWGVTPGHAKMIARVLDANPELTYDALLNLTVKDLIALLSAEKHADKIAAPVKKDYNDAVKALREEYKELFELRDDIEDIEEDLEEDADELTAEEKAALEAELAEKKAKAEALEKEFNEKLEAIKAEYKDASKTAREECGKKADDRKQAKAEGRDFDDDDDDDDDRDDKKGDKKHDDNDDDDDDDDKKGDKKPSKKPEGEKRGDHDDDDDEEDDD